jgi:mono/diheme cytochrome c family protein
VLEVRPDVGSGLPGSVTPRGVILNLGAGLWAGIDVDLIRVAAIWQGTGLTPVALAPGSHRDPTRTTPGGQKPLPEPIGTIWATNGVYPGWQVGQRPLLADPRSPAPSPEEVGRGPLPEHAGRLLAIRSTSDGVVIEYRVGLATAREWFRVSHEQGRPVLERHGELGPSDHPVVVMVGRIPASAGSRPVALEVAGPASGAAAVQLSVEDAIHYVRIEPRSNPVRWCTTLVAEGDAPRRPPRAVPLTLPSPLWREEVSTRIQRSTSTGAYVVDDVPLPLANPWRRDVRLGDVQFRRDGTGVGVTLDGDVWLIRGLASADGVVRWRRFTSGLHEPMSLALRDDEIFVFDRNGIWRLNDRDADGEADDHELFSNAFAQTADYREFPNGIRLAPGGEFVIAKGGQQSATLGKHNGSVLRISADGRRATVLGYGFRQPFIGVDPRTGLVTASDQQGQYIPTTPLHEVRDGRFHGFLSNLEPREQYPAPIAEPLTWIPHAVNASGAAQVWTREARLGELNDSLLHLGFNRPELFRVLLSSRGAIRHTSVVSVTQDFAFPPLYGAVNPADGQLYVSGFQILGWGTTATRVAGLARLRFTGRSSTLPREIMAMEQGVLLRFDVPLDRTRAARRENFRLASWHYQRTYKYGSPQLKSDGTPGIDWLGVGSAHVSRDGRSVFIGVPDLKPTLQLRVGWALTTADGTDFEDSAHLSPAVLAKFDAAAEGFEPVRLDQAPVAAPPAAAGQVSAAEGRRLYQLFGCAACHSLDGSAHASIGPSWKGLYGSRRSLPKSQFIVADEAYLRTSILDPSAHVIAGYQKSEYAMPSYAGVLTDPQIDSLIQFIKSLK